jgi:hypothetical protein
MLSHTMHFARNINFGERHSDVIHDRMYERGVTLCGYKCVR